MNFMMCINWSCAVHMPFQNDENKHQEIARKHNIMMQEIKEGNEETFLIHP